MLSPLTLPGNHCKSFARVAASLGELLRQILKWQLSDRPALYSQKSPFFQGAEPPPTAPLSLLGERQPHLNCPPLNQRQSCKSRILQNRQEEPMCHQRRQVEDPALQVRVVQESARLDPVYFLVGPPGAAKEGAILLDSFLQTEKT